MGKTKAKVQILHTETQAVVEIEPAKFQTFVQSLTGKFTGTKTLPTKPEFSERKTFSLDMHKGSHSIAKVKPKVRIVHIQTPEVIEIEPANFQTLVQILTGKSINKQKELNEQACLGKEEPVIVCDESSNSEWQMLSSIHSSLEGKERKNTGEEQMKSWENIGDDTLIGIEELDKFINELLDFPLYP